MIEFIKNISKNKKKKKKTNLHPEYLLHICKQSIEFCDGNKAFVEPENLSGFGEENEQTTKKKIYLVFYFFMNLI